MAILQGILALGLIIGFFAGIVYLLNKLIDLILNKEGGKLNVETIATLRYDEFCLKQYRSSIRCMCNFVQDNGIFGVYPYSYPVWQSGYKNANIKDMKIFITSIRNMYKSNEYELILQTNIPLECLESLYTSIIYRIIVLKKYRNEVKPMDEKQKILNDIEEAQRKLDEARKKLDEYNEGYKRWKPEYNDTYYRIDYAGGVEYVRWNCSVYDINCYDTYNCFETKKEAQQEADKTLVRRQLEDIAKRLNKGRKINWRDQYQPKYYITWNALDRILKQCENYPVTVNEGVVYCLDKNFLDIAGREIGEDRLIKYIRGEG